MRSLLALVTTLTLFGCQSPPETFKGFEIQQEINRHFSDVPLSENADLTIPRVDTDAEMLRGEGVVSGKDGKRIPYKWAYILNGNGEPIGSFLGSLRPGAKMVPNLSEGDFNDAMKRCGSTYPDNIEKRWACYDRVTARVIDDCELSFTDEDCATNCWYDSAPACR